MSADLHTHSTFSDGSTPAGILPFLAAGAGLNRLAVSDHDSIASVRYAYAHPEQNGVRLVPATELTGYDYRREHRVHILCYWPDDCAPLAEYAAEMGRRRKEAMLQSCAELEAICPQFRTEEALEYARDSGTLYKAHVMRVLWQYGLSDGMYNNVYRSLFALQPVRGKILHTPRYEPVEKILDLVRVCRGVAVLAHPSVYHSMELARELFAAGKLDGVEIEHPRNTAEDKAELCELAQRYDLIVTGGTDYHGLYANTPRPVGTCVTTDEMADRIEALAKQRKHQL
ncbi:MAG: PHP domain-containing protein [Gemmiger sp.]